MSTTKVTKIPNKYNAKNALVVKQVATEFGVTESYVRMCLGGVGKSLNADEIRKACALLRKELDKVIN